MASKLRRTPLFGYDGNLGIPILPAPSTAKGNDAGSADYGFKVSILSGLNGVWIAATKRHHDSQYNGNEQNAISYNHKH
jgi:hypothetical protein